MHEESASTYGNADGNGVRMGWTSARRRAQGDRVQTGLRTEAHAPDAIRGKGKTFLQQSGKAEVQDCDGEAFPAHQLGVNVMIHRMKEWLRSVVCFLFYRHRWSILHQAIFLSDGRCIGVDECVQCTAIRVKITPGMSEVYANGSTLIPRAPCAVRDESRH